VGQASSFCYADLRSIRRQPMAQAAVINSRWSIHERRVRRWPALSGLQCHRRLQPRVPGDHPVRDPTH